jgi:CHAT domain-containing protein/Tfp pilus assembly protein PilF
VALLREVVAIQRTLYPAARHPEGHPDLAGSLDTLGFLLREQREFDQAEGPYREALAMRRALYPAAKFPDGHSELASTLHDLGLLLVLRGDYAEAEPLLAEALAMRRRLYAREPDGHLELAESVVSLARLFQLGGEFARAEQMNREALAMKRKLFPRGRFPAGHWSLALSLNNLGMALEAQGKFADAEPPLRAALEMNRGLYPPSQFPDGDPRLAQSLNNLGLVLLARGEHRQAEPLYRAALAMRRKLYPAERFPDGDPHLVESLNNLGYLLGTGGELDAAAPLHREALALARKLYPKAKYPRGHPQLASSLTNLAAALHARGEYAGAEPLSLEALGMYQQLGLGYAELAAEAECLNYVRTFPLARDGLLATTRHTPAREAVYERLWDNRAALTRLQERRHRGLMAARDPAAAELAGRLRRARLALARLLLTPAADPEKRRAEVDRLTQEKEDLEKRIYARLKLAALPPAAVPAPRRLGELLPAGAAFVDLYRYSEFAHDPAAPGNTGTRHTDRYVAFVLRPGRAPARVELNEAAPIDAARAAWREAITAARPDPAAERPAAAALARLVWEPLGAALPADLQTVYLAPDPALSQLPWSALPGRRPDTVLLDECAVCLVPHGPFLLRRLEERAAGPAGDTLVAYGGVDYEQAQDAGPAGDARGPLLRDRRLVWKPLPGTARELEQVAALAQSVLKDRPIIRTGRTATTIQLQEDLPKARYAHLATHSFFAGPEFRSALQLDPKEFERQSPDRRGGARSPSVLSGLVLAGANRLDDTAAPDRGIVTAEGLLGLRLEGLELAVLSACETGLGEEGGGEGVYGLQRAFHVAGCKNVIASLWKVDDGATHALMALFYRNLWEKKLDPAEALRQAQLTLYRHPEAIEVARKRGVDFTERDLPKVVKKPADRPQRSPTAHWAAFTFSGVRPAGP